ncbi:serine hydrolase, partial [Xanthovirga aplysinae]|uniref:serine hydrolase n=1 Tax=Xanthovirga aplysinae TaxID=2529853 RepID=UPI0012BD27B2
MKTQSIAKNLVYQRKLKGYTQEELSGKTTVTIRTIQRIEKGEVSPHLQTIKLLAVALDIEVDDLLTLENPKEEAIQKKWLLLMHGTPILGFVLPIFNILLPLFLWIHKREDNPIYNHHGIKVINFQISISLLYILSLVALLTIKGWGFYFFIAVIPLGLIITLFNIIKAINDQKCYYPLSIPFIGSNKKSAKIFSTILLVGITLFMGCTGKKIQQVERLDGTTITEDSLTNKINHLIHEANVTGVAVSIFNNNDVIFNKAFGYANIETKDSLKVDHVFYGASFSKAVFGYIVAHLTEQGILDLDTPLQDYVDIAIPDLPVEKDWRNLRDLKGDIRYQKITARMCLSHTTGLPNWRWINNPGEKLRILFEPGAKYSYSGEGLHLLQEIIEHITGKKLEVLAKEIVFDPLKMHNTSYLWDEKFKEHFCYGHSSDQLKLPRDIELDDASAAGSMETTLEDYSKFVKHLMEVHSSKSAVTKLMFYPNIRIRSKAQFGPLAQQITNENDGIELSYGLGWGLLNSPFGFGAFKEGHSEGFQHYTIIFPERKIGIIIMSNSDNAESIFKELLEISIGDIYTPWKWENYIPYQS